MLLEITTTTTPADRLSFLVAKNPTKVQTFEVTGGRAHVYYPELGADRTTVALLVELDPIGLVRGRRGPPGEGGALERYVNDRPYSANSFLSIAIAGVLASALKGVCKEFPEAPDEPLELRALLPVVACRGGEDFCRRIFEPLGYAVTATRLALDESFPEWGEGQHYRLELSARTRLADLLKHLYVLIPVLDNDKHFWVGRDEIDNILAKGKEWIATHPEREAILTRAFRHKKSFVREALKRLLADDDADFLEREGEVGRAEEAIEAPISLNDRRLAAVLATLHALGARSVVDLGCGEGKLVKALLEDRAFKKIAGMDASLRSLDVAADRLELDRMPPRQRERLELMHGALTYRDKRLKGFDVACAIEVIEHIDPPRLEAFERVVFEFARPKAVVVTTPNVEYNVRFEHLGARGLRHRDHRFEWSRAEFEAWAKDVGTRFGYAYRIEPVGDVDPTVGAPTQMAVFTS